MPKGVIYKYTFPDGRVYIGQTRRPVQLRCKEHLDPKIGPTNSRFWEAYQKHGTFEFEVVETIEANDSEELVRLLNEKETELIWKYDATNPAHGCNVRAVGTEKTNAGQILRDACRQLRQIMINERMPLWNSIEEKIVHTHIALSDEEKSLLHDLLLIDIFKGSSNIAEIIDDPHPVLKSSRDDDDGFMMEEELDFFSWAIREDCETDACEIIRTNYREILMAHYEKKAILQLDADGNVVREFYTLPEITDAFGVARADNVLNVLKGRQKSAYGYKWKYKYEQNNELSTQ